MTEAAIGAIRHQGSLRQREGARASTGGAGDIGAASGGRCLGGAVTDDSTARSTADRLADEVGDTLLPGSRAVAIARLSREKASES